VKLGMHVNVVSSQTGAVRTEKLSSTRRTSASILASTRS
jgi:hypothetical protein